MVPSSLPMKKLAYGGSHHCSHGGAEDLVDVCVHEIEGATFKNQIVDCKNYMGRWQFVGRRCLYSSMKGMMAAMQLSCGMFVYRGLISAVIKSTLAWRVASFSIRLMKCFESLMCDGRLLRQI